jgi:sterol desaturase/sphingolipid hydroxylase (fatty acid hydroxylase superfamily)
MELSSGFLAAIALGILWAIEALAPGIHGPRADLAQRLRHIALGLANAGPAFIVVFLLYLADAAARRHGLGLLRALEIPVWAYVLLGFVLLDLWQYVSHTLLHHIPLLWRFHAVHHNADRLDATVAMRFHALEVAVHGLMTIPVAVALGIGIEIVALYNLVLLPMSMFHHSDMNIPPLVDRCLRTIVVTPRMHWIHHSRWQPETDSNYSAVFSVWDRLFGTMRAREHPELIELGLDGYRPEQIGTLRGIFTTPFSDARSGPGHPPRDLDNPPDQPVSSQVEQKPEPRRAHAAP